MTRDHAIKAARKRYGKSAHIRAGERLSSPERREAADVERRALLAKRNEMNQDLDRTTDPTRRAEVEAEIKRLNKAITEAAYWATYRKFAIGQIALGMFFAIDAEGDTWEEAFAEATRKQRETEARIAARIAAERGRR